MRIREVKTLRRHLRRSLEYQSLRSLARRIGISHHALRCFLDSRTGARTTRRVLALIKKDYDEEPDWRPPLLWAIEYVKHGLVCLQPTLTRRDVAELLDLVLRRVEERKGPATTLPKAEPR